MTDVERQEYLRHAITPTAPNIESNIFHTFKKAPHHLDTCVYIFLLTLFNCVNQNTKSK